MNKRSIDPVIFLLVRLILGGIFVYAAIGKIADPYEFAVNIRNYAILPAGWTNIPAIILPWLELICGIFLIAGIWERSSAILITCMMGIFIIAIGSAMARGLDIDCGCYKSVTESGKVGWWRLFEDIVFLVLGILIIFREKVGQFLNRLYPGTGK